MPWLEAAPALPGPRRRCRERCRRIFARSPDLVADVGDAQELNCVALQETVCDVVTPELRI